MSFKDGWDTTQHFLLKQEYRNISKTFETLLKHIYHNADNVFLLLTGLFWEVFSIEGSVDEINFPLIKQLVATIQNYTILYRALLFGAGGGALFIFILPPPKPDDSFGDFLQKLYAVFCGITTILLFWVRLPIAFAVGDGLQVFAISVIGGIEYFIRRRWMSKLQ